MQNVTISLKNVTITRSVKATVKLTADQWQLYTCSMECGEAADGLNQAAEIAIASSSSTAEAMQMMDEAFSKYSKFGAADSEPIHVAVSLFQQAFGDEW